MKQIFTLLTSFLIFANCVSAQTQVSLRINHLLGEQSFALGTEATNNLEDNFVVNRLEYYISGIRIIHDGGVSTKIDKTLLVDASESLDFSLGEVEVTNIEGISFKIGVAPEDNHENPTAFPEDHPLYPQVPSMHWGWAAGYRFVAYEGVCNGNIDFQFHGLGDDNYFGQTINVTPMEENGVKVIELDADYIKAVEDIKLSLGPISHGETGEALDCLVNFANKVFTETVQETNTNISALTVEIATVFPVPATNKMVNIELYNRETYQLKVLDILGRLVQQKTINAATSTVEFEQSGVYFLHLENEKGNIYTQKITVL